MALPSEKLITINDRGARAATTFGSLSAGGANMVFIKKLTASGSGTLSFVDGASSVVLDDTYKEYLFTFKDIHPSANAKLKVNFSIDGGSNYNVAKTTSYFIAYHDEGDSATGLGYQTGEDLAQGTGFQTISQEIGTDNDQSGSGTLQLFNPSSSVFVKHFINKSSAIASDDYLGNGFCAGYCNTTSAVDAVQFKMESGNIDAGDICLYGIL